MADHLTEEEQVDAIKRWLSENWLSIVLPIALLMAAYTGWNYWNDSKQGRYEQGSVYYAQLLDLLEAPPGEALDEKKKAQALALIEEIEKTQGDGLYIDFSRLIRARFSVESKNLDAAMKDLELVAHSGASEAVQLIAKARLARVLMAKEQFDAALALVNATDVDAVKSLYAEIRGDIYVAQNEITAAHTAYQKAIESLAPQQFTRSGILRFKLDSVAPKEESLEPETAAVTQE